MTGFWKGLVVLIKDEQNMLAALAMLFIGTWVIFGETKMGLWIVILFLTLWLVVVSAVREAIRTSASAYESDSERS